MWPTLTTCCRNDETSLFYCVNLKKKKKYLFNGVGSNINVTILGIRIKKKKNY